MTVSELIEILEKGDPKSPVFFKGYACGSSFYDPVTKFDIILKEDEVIFLADWN